MDDFQNEILAAKLVEFCARKHISISAAESCTGGLVASSIVSVSGASAVFKGSAVCYCDASKTDILKVPENVIAENFAESSECVNAMAKGALEIFKSDIALATSGFLDANVGSKPASLAGKVFISCAVAKNGICEEVKIRELSLDPELPRNFNRECAVMHALQMALAALS